jgi:integrase
VDSAGYTVQIKRAVRLGREKAPKTGAGIRLLDLLGPARGALPGRPVGDLHRPVWLNPRTGAHWHEAKALARAFRKACKEAGVRYRYVYQLRHSFASRALSSGENPLWVAKYMGHTDVSQIFKHYGKWIPQSDPLAGSRMVDSKARRGQRAA